MYKLYTVKDQASLTFLKPFAFATDRDAIEGFRHVCNEPETPYYKHPSDYTLVNLGHFDERTGVLTVSVAQNTVARALDLKTNYPKMETETEGEK